MAGLIVVVTVVLAMAVVFRQRSDDLKMLTTTQAEHSAWARAEVESIMVAVGARDGTGLGQMQAKRDSLRQVIEDDWRRADRELRERVERLEQRLGGRGYADPLAP